MAFGVLLSDCKGEQVLGVAGPSAALVPDDWLGWSRVRGLVGGAFGHDHPPSAFSRPARKMVLDQAAFLSLVFFFFSARASVVAFVSFEPRCCDQYAICRMEGACLGVFVEDSGVFCSAKFDRPASGRVETQANSGVVLDVGWCA